MSTACPKHCWHNAQDGTTCCWCGAVLVPYANPDIPHGPHLATRPQLLVRGDTLTIAVSPTGAATGEQEAEDDKDV